jgi:CheY-like chemotaxis protein
MSDGHSQDFDLITLLKSGDLNIRSIAAAKSTITVEEYFNLVSKFIKLAPAASIALTKFANLGKGLDYAKCLKEISTRMTDIGCDKLVPEIESIVDAYDQGDMDFVSDCAKKISDDFSKLYTRTMTAVKKQREALSKILNDDSLTSDNNLASKGSAYLKEVLKQLDAIEATRKLQILAVDDSSVILKTVTLVLSDQYKVFTLAKPVLLEKFLQQITPELFLLDYKMPELSGFDLIPIIRSFKEHEDTPIIFLTSEGTLENLSAAVMLGACDFAVKPVHPEILRDKISNHIVRKKLF